MRKKMWVRKFDADELGNGNLDDRRADFAYSRSKIFPSASCFSLLDSMLERASLLAKLLMLLAFFTAQLSVVLSRPKLSPSPQPRIESWFCSAAYKVLLARKFNSDLAQRENEAGVRMHPIYQISGYSGKNVPKIHASMGKRSVREKIECVRSSRFSENNSIYQVARKSKNRGRYFSLPA